ncbi:MAG TPA: hypothetical protein VGZ02_12960 [Candidatus Baltobacteraceae bacterium]|nr:hypothetical protein [Candidatus Baltobacteraceae bacterium]
MKNHVLVAAAAASLLSACSAGSSPNPAIGGANTSAVRSRAPAGIAFFHVSILPGFGGTSGTAASINARGWIAGSANETGNATAEAALWGDGKARDLGTLGGPSSAIAWPNLDDSGRLAGISEKLEMNPYNEPWSCWAFFPYSSPSYHECTGFRWRDNVMHALPTLGGPDGYAAGTNNLGQVVGWAENMTHDSTCTNGQVLQFEPVYWDEQNAVHQLPTLPGDPDGAATAVNDLGQIAGISGICDQAIGRFTAAHVVIWRAHHVSKLFDVSSVSWNTPSAINQRGDVAGFVNMPGGGDPQGQLQPIAFVWSHTSGLTNIPPLAGDAYSMANGINDEGDVVGVSYGAGFSTARAFLYRRGKVYDLNGLTAPGSPYLLVADAIDDRGNVVGQALDTATGDTPAFVARPPFEDGTVVLPSNAQTAAKPPQLPLTVRERLLRRYGATR